MQLVEIPTTYEIHDNVVGLLGPGDKTEPGTKCDLAWRLYWQDSIPRSRRSPVIATRIGSGGIPGRQGRRPT